MKPHYLLPLVLLLGCTSVQNNELESVLENGSPEFQNILGNPNHEIQIIYGKVAGDSIQHLKFNVDATNFFYPASTVKMPIAFAAIQKAQENGWSLDSQILIDSSEHNPRFVSYDSLFDAAPTIRTLATKIFTYSDNQAYNILYGLLGKNYINQLNQNLGLASSRIIHQLSESAFSFTSESNRHSFKSRVIDEGDTLQFEPEKNSFEGSIQLKNENRGVGYINSGELVNEPFDFSSKNFVSLEDLLGCLERVVKPSFFLESERYSFDQNTYDDLEQIMTIRPRDLPFPKDSLPDNYVKFFLFGDQESSSYPEHIEIRNKVGWAYGYLTDIAYIKDHKENVEFFLAATIHVNENKIYNDGVYEYEEIGLPFLGELGRLVHQYEVARK